jgi:hypothetical protein
MPLFIRDVKCLKSILEVSSHLLENMPHSYYKAQSFDYIYLYSLNLDYFGTQTTRTNKERRTRNFSVSC